MGLILDTSLLIGAERRPERFEQELRSRGDEAVAIAAITAAELLHGCLRAREPGVRARRSAFVEAVLDSVPVLPFGLAEARRHAELWAELARAGTPIDPHDMLVAATVLARGYSPASPNRREFARVPGLRLTDIAGFAE